MSLKRKRSDSELSASSSGGSSFFGSSPVRTASDSYFPALPSWPQSRSTTPAHLPSRTLKRFRNLRPSDNEVHQHTLSLLYQGAATEQRQQQQIQATGIYPPALPAPQQIVQAQVASPQPSQRSLHSFWGGHRDDNASAVSSAASTPPPTSIPTSAHAEASNGVTTAVLASAATPLLGRAGGESRWM